MFIGPGGREMIEILDEAQNVVEYGEKEASRHQDSRDGLAFSDWPD